MIVKLLTEHHLEFLNLKRGSRGSSQSTLVKMSNCWKSHAQMVTLNRNCSCVTGGRKSQLPQVAIEPRLLDLKVSKGAKIRNRYNQVPHLTQDTNGKYLFIDMSQSQLHANLAGFFLLPTACFLHFRSNAIRQILDFLGETVCLFDLILYVPSAIFQLNRDGSSWVEPVLS